jgi:phosphoribosylformylglycinamidine synthase subunit PurQ / glutaminase
MRKQVKAIIITGFGLNCEKESAVGFEVCGASADLIHLNDLIENPQRLSGYHILAFIGGFSFGDHLGAGTVLANRVKYRLGPELTEFISAGKLVLGICNGFQTIARLGLVPALDGLTYNPQVALAPNHNGVFRDDWVVLQCNPKCPCIFTKGIGLLALPIRHGEGKLVPVNQEVLNQMETQNLVALRYVYPDTSKPAEDFPHNPNGSINSIAGICDRSGRIFGLMPHPEAYLSPYNHPHWIRQKIDGVLDSKGMGQLIFQNAVDFAAENLL